jgi:hypothetical protein
MLCLLLHFLLLLHLLPYLPLHHLLHLLLLDLNLRLRLRVSLLTLLLLPLFVFLAVCRHPPPRPLLNWLLAHTLGFHFS